MLTIQFFKRSMLYISLLMITVIASMGCGDDQQVDSKKIAMELNKPKNDIAKEQDERFLVRVAEFDFEQILLGKLAQQRATSADVKDLARMLEDAHRTSKSALSSMAIMKSIAVPSAPTKATHEIYEKINQASVEDFDAIYLTRVIASHNDAISLLEECIGANNDADIRTWAVGMLPNLRTHLTKAMELDAQSGPLSELIR